MMPLMVMVAAVVSSWPAALASTAHCQAACENGPMVCEVVMWLMRIAPLNAHGRGITAAQHDIEFIAQHLVAVGVFQAVAGNQALARGQVRDALENRIVVEQRIAGEVHLRD